MAKAKNEETKKKDKPTVVTRVRQVAVVLSFGGPAANTVAEQKEFGRSMRFALEQAARRQMCKNSAGKFDWGVAKEVYGPVALVVGADTVASKLGIWKRLSNLFRR